MTWKNVYVDKIRTYREFKFSEHVFSEVNAKRSSVTLGSCANLLGIQYRPFEVLDKIGPIAYMMAFLTSMKIHNVFHVSLFKKYVPHHNHVIDWDCDPCGTWRGLSSGNSTHPGLEIQSVQKKIHKGLMELLRS